MIFGEHRQVNDLRYSPVTSSLIQVLFFSATLHRRAGKISAHYPPRNTVSGSVIAAFQEGTIVATT